jgi:hypothetical protein
MSSSTKFVKNDRGGYDVLVDGRTVGDVRRSEVRTPVYAEGGRASYVVGYYVRKAWTWDATEYRRANSGRARCYASTRAAAAERLMDDVARWAAQV